MRSSTANGARTATLPAAVSVAARRPQSANAGEFSPTDGRASTAGSIGSAPVRTLRPAPPFLYQTTIIDVRPDAVRDVIRGFEAVAAHAWSERGTRLCAWFQSKDEPTRFLQVLVFDDARAESAHRESAPARQLAHMLETGSARGGSVTEWTALAGI
jgi:quinol monooxygenase YgiN